MNDEGQRSLGSKRMVANLLAAFVFGVALASAIRRSVEDLTLVFVNAPHEIVPQGHQEQVRFMKTVVPVGSTVFYILDQSEAWQVGLWQRSLYPDYLVIPVHGLAELDTVPFRQLRAEKGVVFSLAAGNPPPDPGFQWKRVLGAYPNSIPTVLGRLPPQ